MTLILYEHPDSPNCRKVRLLLAALGLPHERRRVDLLAGETRSPAFLSINPRGQLPVLVDGSLTLPESNAILLHLAERHARERRGRGIAHRARVLSWLFWQTSGAARRIAAVGFQKQIRPFSGQPPDLDVVARESAAWSLEMRWVDLHLSGTSWLVGGDWTVADIALGAWIEVADHLGMLAELPHIARWFRQLENLEFWRRAPGYELLGPRTDQGRREHSPASQDAQQTSPAIRPDA